MAQIINTNIASLSAQRNLNNSQGANSQALERLSSGLRINSAKDDAAGLAISTRFESQTRGLGQAVRNAGDGVSLAQTAEGALSSITDNLQRVRELAVQSANGTNSDDDRVALQAEVSQLVAEIQRTSEETDFNGRSLFDGNFDGVFQIGANAGQTVGVQIDELTTNRLGTSDAAGVSAIGSDQAIGNGDLSINGVAIQSSRAGDDTASTDNAEASAIAKVAAINRQTDETGVRAEVNSNEVAGTKMDGSNTTGFMKVNGIEIEINTTSDPAQTQAAIEKAVNAVADQTGVRAEAGSTGVQGVKLIAEDGRNVQIEYNTKGDGDLTAASTGLAAAGTYEGGFTLIAESGVNAIEISGGNGTGRGDIANAGLTAGTYQRGIASQVSEAQSVVKSESLGGLVTGSSVAIADAANDNGPSDGAFNENFDTGDELVFALTITDAEGNNVVTDNVTVATNLTGATSASDLVAAFQTAVDASGLEGIVTVGDDGADALTFTISDEEFLGSGFTLGYNATAGAGDSVAVSNTGATPASGTDGTSFDATQASLETSVPINYSLKVGDQGAVTGTLAIDETMASLASELNAESDDASVWEQISFTLDDASGLDGSENLVINGGGADLATIGLNDGMSNADVVNAINAFDFDGAAANDGSNLSIRAELDGDGNVAVTLDNFTGDNLSIATSGAGSMDLVGSPAGTIGTEQFMQGALAVSSNNGDDVSVTLEDPSGAGELFNGTETTIEYAGVNGLNDGDLVINGVQIAGAKTETDTSSAVFGSDGNRILSSDKSLSGIAVAAAINESSNATGVTAEVNATQVVGGNGENVDDALAEFAVGDAADIYISGVSVGTVTLQADGVGDIDTGRARADALNLINQASGKTGVVAEDNGVSLTLTANDGRNISVAIDDKSGADASIGALFGMDAEVQGIGESTFGNGATDQAASAEARTYETTYSTVKLASASEFTVESGANGNVALDALGLTVGSFGGGEDGQFLKDVDISTFEGATAAITAVDNALSTVSGVRSELGAVQNRFESTIGNLEITRENLTAANSRIRDADFAAESAELSRTQVLQQAGISILAQANQRPQQALTLLG